ncbi:MAG: AgmX/PglI C-terminal domain-containing protein, partial [Deltaproteobacteria bacterium]|nr:AgmX/PglI C-terminal domain-containing protein [Deltaproteobacteria bacterium]
RGEQRLPDGPRLDVWLTMDGIAVSTEAGRIDKVSPLPKDQPLPTEAADIVLTALHDALEPLSGKGTVTLWADERVPTRTIVRTLYTTARAGFLDYAFVVGKPRAREIISVVLPEFVWGEVTYVGPAWSDLVVSWTDGAVLAHVRPRYGESEGPDALVTPLDLGRGSCVMPGHPRPETSALRRTLNQLCVAADGKPFAIHVQLDSSQTIGDVLWAVAADDRPAGCRLPTVIEAGDGRAEPRCDGALSVEAAAVAYPMHYRAPGFDEALDDSLTKLFDDGMKALFMVSLLVRETVTVTGPMEWADISGVVGAHGGELVECYERARSRDPGLEARIVVAFTIDSDGTVPDAHFVPPVSPDEQLSRCVSDGVRRWMFPAHADRAMVEVRLPLALDPSQPPSRQP